VQVATIGSIILEICCWSQEFWVIPTWNLWRRCCKV